MSCHPSIRALRLLFFSLFAAAAPAVTMLFPVFAESFPQGSFVSHPPARQERPGTTPRSPLSKPGKGKFLVAGRNLRDPNFSQTVVLIVDYSPEGAIGVVINRPSGLKLSSVFPDIASMKNRTDPLYIGGPVAPDRMMILLKTPKQPESAFRIFEDVYAGGDPEAIAQMIARTDSEERFRAYIGYAGWGPGQLDGEAARGDWHILEADSATIFDKEPSKVWPEMILPFSSKWVHSEVRSLRSEIRGLNPGRMLPAVRR